MALSALFLRVALAGASTIALAGPALANSPVYADTTVTIPYANSGNIPFQNSPELDVALQIDGGFGQSTKFTMDTGSTGVVVDQSWTPPSTASNLGSGGTYYSSSHKQFTGDWYGNVRIQVGDPNNNVTVQVPVLRVNQENYCKDGPSQPCSVVTTSPDIKYFGVGFGREATSQATMPPGQSNASVPSNNPFLNVIAVNGAPVTASEPNGPAGDFTSGYMVTPHGVTLGLTAANTAGFSLTKLFWNDVYSDWNPMKGTLVFNGQTITNTELLTDTGIRYMIVTPGPGSSSGPNCQSSSLPCLPVGTKVTVEIGSAVSYAFTVGQDGTPVPPPTLTPAAPDWAVQASGDPFVNTGFKFFNQFEYMYDYVNGYVGFRDMSAPEPSTWTLTLLGFCAAGLAARRAARRAPALAAREL